jgi:uncharacterized membrane protein YvbJ
MIRCQACGTENPPEAAYCAKCARKLDAETQEAVVQRRAAHIATGIRWETVIVAAVVVFIMAVIIVLIITHAV